MRVLATRRYRTCEQTAKLRAGIPVVCRVLKIRHLFVMRFVGILCRRDKPGLNWFYGRMRCLGVFTIPARPIQIVKHDS